jgi:hypothetical protein
MFTTLLVVLAVLLIFGSRYPLITNWLKGTSTRTRWIMAWAGNIPLIYAASFLNSYCADSWATTPTLFLAIAYGVIVAMSNFWWFLNNMDKF